jgi:hypothetical protein
LEALDRAIFMDSFPERLDSFVRQKSRGVFSIGIASFTQGFALRNLPALHAAGSAAVGARRPAAPMAVLVVVVVVVVVVVMTPLSSLAWQTR